MWLWYEMMMVGGAVIVFMTLFWGYVALTSRLMSYIDVAWPIVFLVAALTAYIRSGDSTNRKLMVVGLLIMWAGRLGYHLVMRLKNQLKEDQRYVTLYGSWDALGALGSWFYLYVVQGLLATVIVSPVIMIMYSGNVPFTLYDMVGLIVWIIGFVWESVADYQLSIFIRYKSNHEAIMNTGLWRYSRHPNYFGEILMWVGMWIISIAIPYGIITIISPITITYLLRYVSGVPLIEAQFEGNSAYDQYKKHTNSLFPWRTL